MKTLRRYHFEDRDYFVTLVTYRREAILLLDIDLFWNSWTASPPIAWVIMSDHAHLIVNPGTQTISELMHEFKIRYSRRFRDQFRPGQVWQNRFWDHAIRDQEDFNRHVDYIHYNPVKHGDARDAFEYAYSSLSEFHRQGLYARDWGRKELNVVGEFGE
ncbi:MAG: transposase [bacterium]